MSTSSRGMAAIASLTHVIDVVLGESASPTPLLAIKTALKENGILNIGDLMGLSKTDIEDLTYDVPNSGNNDVMFLNKGEAGLLNQFQAFVKYRRDDGDPINNNWTSITNAQFDEYRTRPEETGPLAATTHSTTTTTPSNASQRSPANDFKKGIRRDPNMFHTLKDMKTWDNWKRSTIAQARSQGVEEILDANYKCGPNETDKQELFDEKQKYMYGVFEQKLLTDTGKTIVRDYAFDAQTIYAELVKAAVSSTRASLESNDILRYIIGAKFGDGSWKGTSVSYIHHWKNQLRLYHDLCHKDDRFSERQQMTMLQNAVHDIEELRAVKVQADQYKATSTKSSEKSMEYAQYVNLLISAAENYDWTFATKARGTQRPPKRAVYNHEITSYEPDGDDGTCYDLADNLDGTYLDNDCYGIDSNLEMIQAHAHERLQGSRMGYGKWQSLDPASRELWDKLPDEAKVLILSGRRPAPQPARPGGRNFSTGRPPSRAPRPATTVNLHDISVFDYFNNCLPQTASEPDTQIDEKDDTAPLLAHLAKRNELPPASLLKVMSSTMTRSSNNKNNEYDNDIKIHGETYRKVNMAQVIYSVSNHRSSKTASLVDRGANGGIAGDDVRIMSRTGRSVDIQGINNHQITDIPIVTVGGVTTTQKGRVILIMNQYAYHGKGKTIHSAAQFEWYKNNVNDKSIKVEGGLQRIVTNDGYVIPINICDGLPYIDLEPYTDIERETLPHVFMTSDLDWDPSVLDHKLTDDEQWHDALTGLEANPHLNLFDEFGDYRKRVIVQEAATFHDAHETPPLVDDIIEDCIYSAYVANAHEVAPREVIPREPNYEALRPMFGWLSVDVIKRTFAATTQFARMPTSTILQKHYKSPFPACNVHRRNESVATDTVYSNTAAVDSGAFSAQIFVGTTSLLTDVYGMKTDKQFVNTLEDNIRTRGAPNKLISDRAQVEISKKVVDILRALFISSWQSEPEQQHQNFAERHYQSVKRMTNTVLDRTAAPAYTWLLCLMYVCFILNVTVSSGNNNVPLQVATGSMADISPLLRFRFMEPVYYKVDDSDFPSESRERRGYFVGFAEHVGHYMTIKVLTDDTKKVIYRSNVRSALDEADRNLRMDPLSGEIKTIVKSRQDNDADNGETKKTPTGYDYGEPTTPTDDDDGETNNGPAMAVFNPEDLVGRTFLLKPQEEDGQRFRARIVRSIQDQEDDLVKNPTRISFLLSLDDDTREEIMSYNEVLNHIEDTHEDNVVWKFRRITAHEGPLRPTHPSYKGSEYNVMIEWENGEITTEPLKVIAADDPVTCALYAFDQKLLDTPGWKRFRSIANRQKKLLRMANQAKLRSFRTAPKYQYGYQVPRTYSEAVMLDEKAGNTKWQDATKLEMEQLDEYDTFTDHGLDGKPPDGYKKIKVHLIFAIKHDGRHKARCVADGHLTDIPTESVYSGVVSLRGLRTIVFLGELNKLQTWATDIGNAYLEALTLEKVYIRAGPEFGERQGHTLVIYKALYGLRSSGQRWHERFAECLEEMGFFPCKAEPDIWMRKNGDVYEYIATYVDDLAIAAKDPESITNTLMNKYKFKLKGTGPIKFHLGCDFWRDTDGVMCMAPLKYIEKMVASYEFMFGEKPKTTYMSPLEKGDHPETDTTELLDQEGIQKYQSLIGSMQWAVSIGRIDITTAVMTMSGFRTAPRLGHLDRCKRIYGYLAKMKHAIIRIRTEEPDFSDIPDQEYDWARSVYGDVKELLPQNAPEPLGNFVTLSHYVDANLFHDLLTGRSVTGILHFTNKTPIDWYSKKQATVETATYGSEFVAARTCTEQVIDLRTTLRYLGVPIRNKSYMFGDNKSVVDSSMTPHAKLHKRHTALSFHRVREAIAGKIIGFYHIAGEHNPADILSKHWGYQQVWKLLKPLLFWQGDTLDILKLTPGTENGNIKWHG